MENLDAKRGRFVVGVVTTFLTAEAPERSQGLLYAGGGAARGGLLDYRVQAGVLVLLVAAIVWVFR